METVTVRLDCSPFTEPDLSAIDAIARLELRCRRCGCELRLRNANADLVALIGFAGLAGVLRLESEREAEEREQAPRVEEERDLGDPPA